MVVRFILDFNLRLEVIIVQCRMVLKGPTATIQLETLCIITLGSCQRGLIRFDGRNGKCTLVNARAVTDFARVGGKIMQMFEGSYKCPLEVSPRIDDRSNLDGRFSININVMFQMQVQLLKFMLRLIISVKIKQLRELIIFFHIYVGPYVSDAS